MFPSKVSSSRPSLSLSSAHQQALRYFHPLSFVLLKPTGVIYSSNLSFFCPSQVFASLDQLVPLACYSKNQASFFSPPIHFSIFLAESRSALPRYIMEEDIREMNLSITKTIGCEMVRKICDLGVCLCYSSFNEV